MAPELSGAVESSGWDTWWAVKFPRYRYIYEFWYHFLWKAYRRLLNEIPSGKVRRVLEIGCGRGEMSFRMAREYGCKVVLLDKSSNALALARERFRGASIEVDYIQGDVFDLGIKEQFDLVHSEGLLEHFEGSDMEFLLRLHAEATVPGGYVLTFAPFDSIFYKLSSWFLRATGNWCFGYEVPIPPRRHLELYHRTNLSVLGQTYVVLREFGVIGRKGWAVG